MRTPAPYRPTLGRGAVRLRAASHYVTFWLARTFPERFPMCVVVGYPKSGTTWVCQVLADYLRLPFPRNSLLPVGCPAVVHGHELGSDRYPRSVYVVRDGRDVMVSLYHHLVRFLEIPDGDDPTLTREQRAVFPVMKNRNAVRENLPAFLERQMTRPHSVRANWPTHVRSVLDGAGAGLPILRYEELRTDPVPHATPVVERLSGESADVDELRSSFDRFSFSAQSGRREGEEDRGSFLRKGIIGDWKNHFTPEAEQIFDRWAGAELRALGYSET